MPHALFEQMKTIKVDRAQGVVIRAGLWQTWLQMAAEIEADLDTAHKIIDTTEPVPAEVAQQVVQSRARRRSA